MPIKDLYYQKYLKYKNKYLNLHNQIGGAPRMVVHQGPDQSSRRDSSSQPTTLSNDEKINKQLHELNKQKTSLNADVFFDRKHALHMLMDNKPPSAIEHDKNKVKIGDSYYYTDSKDGRQYRVLSTGRSYLKDEQQREWETHEYVLRAEYMELEKKIRDEVKLRISSKLEEQRSLDIRALFEKLNIAKQNLENELRHKLEEELRPKLEEQLRPKLEEQLQRELKEQLQRELEKQVEPKMQEMSEEVAAKELLLYKEYDKLLVDILNEEVGPKIKDLYYDFNVKLSNLWRKQQTEGRTDIPDGQFIF